MMFRANLDVMLFCQNLKVCAYPAKTKYLYNICTTSVQVIDIGPTLYKLLHITVLCLLGS